MSNVRQRNDGHYPVLSLCRTICIWATWVHVVAPLPQAATDGNVARNGPIAATLALIPSAPKATALIPSAPISSTKRLGLIPSQPQTAIIPSQLPASVASDPPLSTPPPGLIPSQSAPTGLIPSASISSDPHIGPIPSQSGIPSSAIESPIPSEGSITQSIPNVSATLITPSMASTDEGLRPIPAPTTATGDPDGHHEIPEPNFSVTVPCRGCSPIIEISATGWGDSWPTWPTQPAQEQQETTQGAPQATITAGPSSIVVSQAPSGGGFVIGGSTTVKPGQTITVDNTPIAIQTSAGQTQVIVGGTHTIPLTANNPPSSQITDAPVLLPVTVGGQTLTPIANPDPKADPKTPGLYMVAGQTLIPGGDAIIVSGTTISLLPSATAIVINGQTSMLAQAYGAIYTSTALPALTLWNHVYTANRAGYYIISPGTTLIAGGPPVTVSGTVVSLEPRGTAAVIQGSTSFMQPLTTIVTLTKSNGAAGAGDAGYSTGGGAGGALPYPTGKPHSGGAMVRPGVTFTGDTDGWIEGVFMLGVLALGWLAAWL